MHRICHSGDILVTNVFNRTYKIIVLSQLHTLANYCHFQQRCQNGLYNLPVNCLQFKYLSKLNIFAVAFKCTGASFIEIVNLKLK